MKCQTENTAILFYPDHNKKVTLPISLLPIHKRISNCGYNVIIIDAQLGNQWRDQLYQYAKTAVFLGISCMTGKPIISSVEAIKIARSAQNRIPVIWGGYHASLYYQQLIASGYADFVVRGQGEFEIEALAEMLAGMNHNDIRQLPLTFRVLKYDHWWKAGTDELLNIDYSGLHIYRYRSLGMKLIPYISSYGCKASCRFCVEPSHSDNHWYSHSAEKVVEDLARLYRDTGYQRVAILDPNMAIDVKRFARIVYYLVKSDLQVRFACNMCVNDIISLKKIVDFDLLRKAGCRQVFIGAESGSRDVLKRIKKRITPEKVIEACNYLQKAKIQTMVSFMHDFPFETMEDSMKTIELSKTLAKLKNHRQTHHFYYPFLGTSLGNEYCKLKPAETSLDEISTFQGCSSWAGRKKFRQQVIKELLSIKQDYPRSLSHDLPIIL